jgi:Dolichyl-phosphate-mannose-protein mannosyltransferase
MAVDTRVEAVAAARVTPRVSPAFALGALIAVSFAVRLAFAWARATPNRYPDEYLYAELGRSFASMGLPLVRGHLTNFPALLMPLLTAPAWLFHDVGTSFRVIQAVEVLAMSLAAVPAYFLARRLRLGTNAALAVAALALAVPNFLSSAYIVASPFAYPLSILVTYVGIAALERPSRRSQLVLVGLFVVAALLRTQFMITPFAFLAAATVVGLRERRLRRVLSEQRLVLALLALALCVLAVVGLGYYSDAVHVGMTNAVPRALGFNVLVIAFASGWVIVPGALVALRSGSFVLWTGRSSSFARLLLLAWSACSRRQRCTDRRRTSATSPTSHRWLRSHSRSTCAVASRTEVFTQAWPLHC